MKPKIEYINYGIGFTVNDGNKKWIQLNKNLNKYPKLKKQVLTHELLHFNSKNKHIDFMIDFMSGFDLKKSWEILKFSFKHPRAFLANTPFFYENRRFSVNWFMFLFYCLTISVIIGGISLL